MRIYALRTCVLRRSVGHGGRARRPLRGWLAGRWWAGGRALHPARHQSASVAAAARMTSQAPNGWIRRGRTRSPSATPRTPPGLACPHPAQGPKSPRACASLPCRVMAPAHVQQAHTQQGVAGAAAAAGQHTGMAGGKRTAHHSARKQLVDDGTGASWKISKR